MNIIKAEHFRILIAVSLCFLFGHGYSQEFKTITIKATTVATPSIIEIDEAEIIAELMYIEETDSSIIARSTYECFASFYATPHLSDHGNYFYN